MELTPEQFAAAQVPVASGLADLLRLSPGKATRHQLAKRLAEYVEPSEEFARAEPRRYETVAFLVSLQNEIEYGIEDGNVDLAAKCRQAARDVWLGHNSFDPSIRAMATIIDDLSLGKSLVSLDSDRPRPLAHVLYDVLFRAAEDTAANIFRGLDELGYVKILGSKRLPKRELREQTGWHLRTMGR
jgi:hypothetical protein